MPNYEDFKKYGEMEKQKKAEQADTPPPALGKQEPSGLKKLFGKLKKSAADTN